MLDSERHDDMSRLEAAVIAACAKPTSRLFAFEDGSDRCLLVDIEAGRWYVLHGVVPGTVHPRQP